MHPLNTFIIYARDDKEYKNQLLRHLRPLVSSGYLNVWHDGDILPGEDWEKAIKKQLKSSQLVLILISVNCLNSDFIETQELQSAILQLREGHTRIIPIVVSPCGWRYHKLLVGLQGLPEDMKPVSEWPNPDRAWTNVIESLAQMVDELRLERAEEERKIQEAAEKEAQEQSLREQAAREQAERQRQAEQFELQRKLAIEKSEQEAALLKAKEEQDRQLQELKIQHQKELEIQKQKDEQKLIHQRNEASRLAQIEYNKAETDAWNIAVSHNTRDAYLHYYKNYKDSQNSDNAKILIRRLHPIWPFRYYIATAGGMCLILVCAIFYYGLKSRQNINTNPATSNSEQINPDSLIESKNALQKEKDWLAAQQSGNINSLKIFAENYPDDKRIAAVNNSIDSLNRIVRHYLYDANNLMKNGLSKNAKTYIDSVLKIDPENEGAHLLLKKMK